MPTFYQILRVATYASLPTNVKDGSVAYCVDSARHYMFASSVWYTIPNSVEVAAKTSVRFWDAGAFKNGTPGTGDIVILTDSMTISSSGNAVFNVTNDHTATGTALCSSFITNGVVANFVDSTGVYSQGSPTVAGNLKTITIATTKQAQSGVVLLSTTIVGSVTQPASPNGTVVRLFAIGISV